MFRVSFQEEKYLIVFDNHIEGDEPPSAIPGSVARVSRNSIKAWIVLPILRQTTTLGLYDFSFQKFVNNE